MTFVAFLKDAIIETLDRKSLYVMLIISLFFILLCASCSYEALDEKQALEETVQGFGALVDLTTMQPMMYNVSWSVPEFRKLSKSAGDDRDGYEFVLEVAPIRMFHELIRKWESIPRVAKRKKPAGMAAPESDEVTPEKEIAFLQWRFRELMMPGAQVELAEDLGEMRRFQVRLKMAGQNALMGAYRMSVLFGVKSFRLPLPLALTVFYIESFLSEWGAGLVGVLIGLLITVGSVPSMLQKGSLDVLLSKPVRRWTVILYKYLGGLTYSGVTSLVFIGGSWLAISAQSGIWNWGYLASLGTLMIFYAVVYAISVLFAVLTRSVVAAIVVPLVAWFFGWGINGVKNLILTAAAMNIALPMWLADVLDVISYALPRAGDINAMNDYFMLQGSYGEGMEDVVKQLGLPEVAWLKIVLSSAALIVVCLSLACWRFSRRDA